MKCKDCGKKIKNWLRVLLRYRVKLKYCIWCNTARLTEYRERVIFAGTFPGKSCLENVFNDTYCPLYMDSTCIPGLDEEYKSCPYKDGWKICIHYIENAGKLDKGLTAVGDLASLSYAMYKDMVKDNE